jgi:hypothetical protein
MSFDEKVEKLNKVNGLFNKFILHINEIRDNVDNQAQYTEGYMACMSDILKNISEGKDSELLEIIRMKYEMQIRKEVLEEVSSGMTNLYTTYEKVLKE